MNLKHIRYYFFSFIVNQINNKSTIPDGIKKAHIVSPSITTTS